MTWLERVRAAFRAPERKAGFGRRLIALQMQGRAVWSPRDLEALAREGFMGNAVAYRCVRAIAEAAASVPWLLYDGERELTEHPLLALLAHPGGGRDAASFLEELYGYLLVAGNAFVERVALDGVARELIALRPDRVRVVPGPDGWPAAFEYAVGGRTETVPASGAPAPILHLRLFHPLDDHYGFAPLQAAAAAIDIHNAGAGWTKSLLDNAARPSGALVYAGEAGRTALGADAFERLKDELQDAYSGGRNAGRPLLLEGGLDWKPMSFSPADMDFSGLRHAAAREIALALGVPPMLLGLPGDNTYANYREANLAFWRGTVMPLVQKTGAALAAWLQPDYGGALRLAPDLDAAPALAPEREALWARVTAADFLTEDEKRAAVGYGPRGDRS